MKKVIMCTVLILVLASLTGCGHKHTPVVDAAIPTTCTETGLSEGSHCSECGEVIKKQSVVEALGHNVVTDPATAPTCSSNGLTEGSHCSVCDEIIVEQKQIDKLEHSVVIDEAVAATTTSTGLTEGSHCSVCGEVIVAQETVPVLVNYEAPYCPGNFSKIGETFSSFHVAGTGLQYSPASLAILLKQQYPFNCPGKGAYYECWDAYTDYNGYGSRVGVYNDKVVFNIQDLDDGVKVSEALPSDMLAIEPLIIYGYDNYGTVREQMLLWRGDNGYTVCFAEARKYPNGSYLDEYIKFSISTTDLMHIYGIPQEVHDAKPAFN